MKRWIAVLLVLGLVFALAGCNNEKAPSTTQTQPSTQPPTQPEEQLPVSLGTEVALCLPAETQQWKACAAALQTFLWEKGHSVQTYYAADSAREQVKQIRDLVQKKVDLLVVAAVDSLTLGTELDSAAAAGVQVVSLDRQVLHATGITAAVTFDYMSMGVAIGHQIEEAKQLRTALPENRSYTIEFFMGSADDHNAFLLHQGIMAVLQPYLDNGVLVCRSGRVSLEDTYIPRWDAAIAKDKCAQHLQSYPDAPLDIVCAASDDLAAGCAEALTEAGYTPQNWPVITGVGGDQKTIRNILNDRQSHTVYRDTEALHRTCGYLAHNLLTGEAMPEPENVEVNTTNQTYICRMLPVSGIAGIGQLLKNGVTAQSLDLTQEDTERIAIPEDTVPAETTPPAEPEVTEPETT